MYEINEAYGELLYEESLPESDIELKFTNNLANEFIRTVNEFTSVCAKMVKNRSVSKNLYQKYDDLSSKIKNLVEAAKNSK
jgi:hypothetical protein